MTKPMVLGLLVAIALFWAVGAYNRLVRLRSEVVKAYSALDNVLSVHPAVIKAAQPLADVAAGVLAAIPGRAVVAPGRGRRAVCPGSCQCPRSSAGPGCHSGSFGRTRRPD
jgi:hypothetical protein